MYDFTTCARSFEIWDPTAQIKLGWYHSDKEAWRWARAAAVTCSVSVPKDMDAGATPIGTPRRCDDDGYIQREENAATNVEEVQCAADALIDEPPPRAGRPER